MIMNTQAYNSGVKLLTEVVPHSSAVEAVMLLHHADPMPGELESIEEIHVRAETMTSLLKDILDYQPATHWGINE
jgi:hypothetical protein